MFKALPSTSKARNELRMRFETKRKCEAERENENEEFTTSDDFCADLNSRFSRRRLESSNRVVFSLGDFVISFVGCGEKVVLKQKIHELVFGFLEEMGFQERF
jgi:hypothetical protein